MTWQGKYMNLDLQVLICNPRASITTSRLWLTSVRSELLGAHNLIEMDIRVCSTIWMRSASLSPNDQEGLYYVPIWMRSAS
jgi:hypothetical protein